MSVKRVLILLAIYAVVFVVIALGPQLYWLATDKDYYGWPAVTKCAICEKTVWEWQSYDRRPIPVELNNPDGLVVSCSMSGLMHTKCKGLPKPRKASVELVPVAPAPKQEWF